MAPFAFAQGVSDGRFRWRDRKQHPHDIGATIVDLPRQAHGDTQQLGGVGRVGGLAGKRQHLGLLVNQIDQRHHQSCLGANAVVDRLDRRVGCLGDIRNGRRGVAALGEEAAGGNQDAPPCRLCMPLPPCQPIIRHRLDFLR